jgi:excisionase family DNA binding protein
MATDAKYLHVKEVAAELRQHPATIYRKILSGQIPSVRLGEGHSALRVPVDELEAWLRREESAATAGMWRQPPPKARPS